jgi:Ni2+-binding GTPase involved in maturation of urease and hydrogenase
MARRVNPGIEVLCVSAKSGDGMRGWQDWIEARVAGA